MKNLRKFQVGDLVVGNSNSSCPGIFFEVIGTVSLPTVNLVRVIPVGSKTAEFAIALQESSLSPVPNDLYSSEKDCTILQDSAAANAGIKSVTINENKRKVTVVFGENGYTIATCSEEDDFDPAVGVALALAYRRFGSKTKFHKYVDSLVTKGGNKRK